MKCSLFLGGCSFKGTTYLLGLKSARIVWQRNDLCIKSSVALHLTQKSMYTLGMKKLEIKRQSASRATVLADLTVTSPPLKKKNQLFPLLSEDFQWRLYIFVVLIPTYADFLDSFKIARL